MAKTDKTPTTSKKNPKANKEQSTASTKVSDLITPNRTFTLTISSDSITEARGRALVRAQKSIKLDGFRPGKVPLKLVEERLGRQGIMEMVLEDLLPKAYGEYIETNKLQPLTEPDIQPKSMEPEGKDWEFEVAIAVAEPIELGDYVALVKATPASDHAAHDGHNHTDDELRQIRLQDILKTLLEKIKVAVPELLLRRETEHRLQSMTSQLERVNLSLEDYLKNIGKTKEDLQQDYAINTFASLQVELLLAAIITQAKLEVSNQELESLVQARLAARKEAQISRQELNHLHSHLLKQKAIEHLLSL